MSSQRNACCHQSQTSNADTKESDTATAAAAADDDVVGTVTVQLYVLAWN